MAAAAGLAVAAALGLPRPIGAACAMLPLVGVVLVDRRRWARMETGFSWGGSVEDVARIAAELEARGVHARVLTEDTGFAWGERAHPRTAGLEAKTASLAYLNGDADAVAEILREHGIRPPDLR